MDLTEEQKAQVSAWIGEGLGLAEVQKRLADEFGVSMTFMDVRFLVDDLNLQLHDAPAKAEADITKQPPPSTPAEPVPDAEAAPAGGPGKVTVSVDPLQRPGALVSGSVTFSDGESMGWQLDQSGRLGLIPGANEGYRPSEDDIAEFQLALQTELQKKGF